MRNSTFVSIIALTFFAACSTPSAEENAAGNETVTPAAAASTTPDTTKSVWKDVNSSNPQPITVAPQAASKKSTVALNPPHGEPNHRCDIEVGAPLNGDKQSVQQTAPPATALPAQGSQGSAKLNPAHGEPGHDCSVAVGAPLKAS
jgi:hypothetical protein